jgi:hypothetical protein
MKLPIQPKICAWPCAWIHAGETEFAARWLLIVSKFQTPRKVPGRSMNNTPVLMYSISMRDSALSRAAVMLTISLAASRLPASLSMRVGRVDIGGHFNLRYRLFSLATLSVEFPFNPVFPEQLNWVLSSDGSISAAKVISGHNFSQPQQIRSGYFGFSAILSLAIHEFRLRGSRSDARFRVTARRGLLSQMLQSVVARGTPHVSVLRADHGEHHLEARVRFHRVRLFGRQ